MGTAIVYLPRPRQEFCVRGDDINVILGYQFQGQYHLNILSFILPFNTWYIRSEKSQLLVELSLINNRGSVDQSETIIAFDGHVWWRIRTIWAILNISNTHNTQSCVLSNYVVCLYYLIRITLKIIIKLQVSFYWIIGAYSDTIIFCFSAMQSHIQHKETVILQSVYLQFI